MSTRLAYIVSHPIQYQAPLLRRIASDPDIDLTVMFLSDFSLREHHESAFGQSFRWDVPLTEGYRWEVLSSGGSQSSTRWPVRNLKRRVTAGNFDAVWVHGWGRIGLIQAITAAHALHLPVLLRGESTPSNSNNTGAGYLRDKFLGWLFGKVAAFLCIGSVNREFYRLHGISEEKLFSVPYAVDNDWFSLECERAAAMRDQFRQGLGLREGRPIILFAAKFIPEKAPQDLLSAFLEIVSMSAIERPYLLFAGDGPLRNQMEKQAAEFAGKDIRFLGFRNQTELPALYDLCDLFVLPSRFEPWGLVMNEVMNAGRPIIVSDRVGAGPDLVRQSENGWIFPAGDVRALANCIRDALTSADLKTMGLASKTIVQGWNFEADIAGLKNALAFGTS
jgi:glycosyltransferase involved in cell wall biosynthesis